MLYSCRSIIEGNENGTTYRNTIRILLANALSLGLAFLCVDTGGKHDQIGIAQQMGSPTRPLTKGVFVLEFGTHCDL